MAHESNDARVVVVVSMRGIPASGLLVVVYLKSFVVVLALRWWWWENGRMRTTAAKLAAGRITCPHCEHTWTRRKHDPIKCTRCWQYLDGDPKTCNCKFCLPRRTA